MTRSLLSYCINDVTQIMACNRSLSRKKRSVFYFILFAILSANVSATTQYVVDELRVVVRTGASTEYKVIKVLNSGASVQVLGKEQNGYKKVRLESGQEGWVLSQYLVDIPIARDRLDNAQTRMVTLEAENNRLSEASVALRRYQEQLSADLAAIKAVNTQLENSYRELAELSSNAIAINEEKNRLLVEVTDLKAQLTLLRSQAEKSKQQWLYTGAVLIIFGLAIGLILSRIRPTKSKSWDDL